MENDYANTNDISNYMLNLFQSVADKSLKKIKCRTRKNIPFEFNDECNDLKHDFRNKANEFKLNIDNNDKRINAYS